MFVQPLRILALAILVTTTGLSFAQDTAALTQENSRTFTANKRYLIFPRADGLVGTDQIAVEVNGKPFLSVFDSPIAKTDPDFWTYLDLSLIQGKGITVRMRGPNEAGIELVKLSDTIPGRYPLYHEPGRPQVHFSPLRGWLNDPSGMIYFDGLWHLSYANTRFANRMAGPNNAWGHATSRDLLHWEEAPMLLNPVRGQYSFWTGGAAVDVENTTGLGHPDKAALVFSANNGSDAPNEFTQCVFPSIDGGMSVIFNPEMMFKPLPADVERRGGGTRDPMILWYAPEKKWVLIVYNKPKDGKDGFYFYESRDLKSWQETSVLEGMFECPNLFELPVDGNPARKRWVIWGSDTSYYVGVFDGKTFVPEGRKHRMHLGGFSASQIFANAPGGRIVQIGWAHLPESDFQSEFTQMASFPLELSLKTTPQGLRLSADFISELATLRDGVSAKKDIVINPGKPLILPNVPDVMELDMEFDPGTAAQVTITANQLNLKWTAATNDLEFNSSTIPVVPKGGRVRLHVLLDVPSLELVSNGGEYYTFEPRDFKKLDGTSPLKIAAEGGAVTLHSLNVYPLKSIQPPAIQE